MSNESEAYALVIGDLRSQRDEIDRTITRLEALAAGNPIPNTPKGELETETQSKQTGEIEGRIFPEKEGEFLGMKVIEATQIVLKRRRKPMSPADITTDLERGGLLTAGSKTISTLLMRRRNGKGDIVSPKRGLWGLKEWYPRRNFGKTDWPNKNGANESSEPIQPSAQPQIVPLRSDG